MTTTAITTAPPGERIDYTSTLSPRAKALVLAGVMMGHWPGALFLIVATVPLLLLLRGDQPTPSRS